MRIVLLLLPGDFPWPCVPGFLPHVVYIVLVRFVILPKGQHFLNRNKVNPPVIVSGSLWDLNNLLRTIHSRQKLPITFWHFVSPSGKLFLNYTQNPHRILRSIDCIRGEQT